MSSLPLCSGAEKSELVDKFDNSFAIRRKGMCHVSALIFLLHKSCMNQTPRMLRYCLDIATQLVCNILKRYSFRPAYFSENFYPPMIRNSFQVPFQLPCSFHTFSAFIVYPLQLHFTTFSHS